MEVAEDANLLPPSAPAAPIPFGEPITDLGAHVLLLLQKDGEGHDGFDTEFGALEKRASEVYSPSNYTTATLPHLRAKNRYSNVLPLETSRVKLTDREGQPGADYINANWVDGLTPTSKCQYISTQGPLPDTVFDFWRMVIETGANVVVMLTKEVENDRIKCSFYWPGGEYDESGSAFTFDNFRLTLLEADHSHDNQLVTRRFLLEKDGAEPAEITQYQFKEWPDHGLPDSAEAFRDMLHKVDRVRKVNSPIVVHCSAGIGRTGTFCTVHSMIEQLELHLKENPGIPPSFNVMDTVNRLRGMRTGMVQTKDQYMFCYKTLIEETQKLGLKLTPVDTHQLH